MPDRPATLDDVLITDELTRRAARLPDRAAEVSALHSLAQCLADEPDIILDRLLTIGLVLCDAGTAGVSLLERDENDELLFRWVALAGALASHVGGSTPRGFSPCGVCLDRGAPQLFRDPWAYFTYFQAATPAIVEGLVIPIRWHDRDLGTIWIASHDDRRAFDREDARVMESLASFTAAALCVRALRQEAETAARRLEQRVAERTTELAESREQLMQALATKTAFEQARTDWLRTVMSAQEDERRRVARELHDEMSQHLVGLALGLDAIRGSSDRGQQDAIDRLQATIAGIDRGVHRLARDLRPAELDDLGLATALTTYVDEWSRRTGIVCEIVATDDRERLPAAVETTVYRIVQEALTNVARHAAATRAGVVIGRDARTLHVVVEDDGRGFDVDAGAGRGAGRLGLAGMRERAALVDGVLTIESSMAGTTLFLTLPIAHA